MTEKATRQIEQNRLAGDPAMHEKPETQPKRVSDVVDSKMDALKGFYPMAERVDFRAVTEWGDLVILDCVIIEDFKTDFGSHPMVVVAVDPGHDREVCTFPVSASVVLDKLRQLKAKDAFPIVGRFFKAEGKNYYDIE